MTLVEWEIFQEVTDVQEVQALCGITKYEEFRMEYPYEVVDADNHDYEPDDCFTRYLEPEFSDRACHIHRDHDGVGAPFVGKDPSDYLKANPADLIGRTGAVVAAKYHRHEALPNKKLLRPAEVPASMTVSSGCSIGTSKRSRPS